MTVKYFGLVEAHINNQARRVDLKFSPRRREPLADQTRQRCVDWALDCLTGLQTQGYDIFLPDELANFAETAT